MINALNISKSYGDQSLFSGLTVNVTAGQRIALIGSNGSGKSTLLDILAGETSPDAGIVSKSRHVELGYLKQDLILNSASTLLDEVLEEPSEVKVIRGKINNIYEFLSSNPDRRKQNELLKRLSQLAVELEASAGRFSEYECKSILAGLGFDQSEFSKPLKEFSGGWLMRVALGRLLYRNPDLLLLDEPTNHLDLDANIWFERFLKSFKGAVMFTSHDRAFVNQVATMVLAIETGEVVSFKGNYDDYVVARERSLKTKQSAAIRQEQEIQRQMRFVERFRSKARKAPQVQSRLKRIERIERIQLPRSTKRVHYTFPQPARSGTQVISLTNVCKAYGDRIVYRDLNLILERGDRVALVGPNGAGKSTMLKILAGVIPYDRGERKTGHNVVTAYYAQHLFDLLNNENTVLQELQLAAPEEPDQNLRHILGGFLFSGDDVRKPVSVLSGGEKARIALAKVLVQRSNLLFMDEPTNHLDITSREILTDALSDYRGSICFVTHDRTVIRAVANKIIEINHGKPVIFSGDWDSYVHRKKVGIAEGDTPMIRDRSSEKNLKMDSRGRRSAKRRPRSTRNRKDEVRRGLYKKARTLAILIEKTNAAIVSREAQITQMEERFSRPDQFGDTTRLTKLGEEYQVVTNESKCLWAEWERLSLDAESVNTQLLNLNETE